MPIWQSRRSTSTQARRSEDSDRWRERAGIALSLGILTLLWLVLTGDASAVGDRANANAVDSHEIAASLSMSIQRPLESGVGTSGPVTRVRANIGDTSGLITLDPTTFANGHALGARPSLALAVAPEPDTVIMTALGLAGLAWVSQRQARTRRSESD